MPDHNISNEEIIKLIDQELDPVRADEITSLLKTDDELRKTYNEFLELKTLMAEAYLPMINELTNFKDSVALEIIQLQMNEYSK